MKCHNCGKEVNKKDMKINSWKYCEPGVCKVITQYYCPFCGWVLDRIVK